MAWNDSRQRGIVSCKLRESLRLIKTVIIILSKISFLSILVSISVTICSITPKLTLPYYLYYSTNKVLFTITTIVIGLLLLLLLLLLLFLLILSKTVIGFFLLSYNTCFWYYF